MGTKREGKENSLKELDKNDNGKVFRGKGFKDFELFNKALLGKQVWRMLNELDSLWVRVGWVEQPPSSLVYILDKDVFPAPHDND